jgi:hypothetical protein
MLAFKGLSHLATNAKAHLHERDEEARHEFSQMLEVADEENFEDLLEVPLITDCGWDKSGRRVILFVPAYLNIREENDDKLAQTFRFVASTMSALLADQEDRIDSVTEFVMIYDHTSMSWWEVQFFDWIKTHTSMIPHSYVDTLQALYVLHPDASLKAKMLTYYPLFDASLWSKIQYVDTIDALCDVIMPDDPVIHVEFKRRFPHLVQREDMIVRGLPPPHVLGMRLDELCEQLGVEYTDAVTHRRYPFLPPPLLALCRVLLRRGELHGHEAAVNAIQQIYHSDSAEIYDIVADLDEGEPLPDEITVESIWCALKLFLDCLPIPLLSFQAYQEIRLRNMPETSTEKHKEFLQEILHHRLPACYAYAALYLASFLQQFVHADELEAKHEIEKDGVKAQAHEVPTLRCLAEIFAPSLFRPKVVVGDLHTVLPVAVGLTESLILMADDLWADQDLQY